MDYENSLNSHQTMMMIFRSPIGVPGNSGFTETSASKSVNRKYGPRQHRKGRMPASAAGAF